MNTVRLPGSGLDAAVKDAMSHDVLAALDAAGIGIASATYDIVGPPPIRLRGRVAPHEGSRA